MNADERQDFFNARMAEVWKEFRVFFHHPEGQ
jgi:hypothetical protein